MYPKVLDSLDILCPTHSGGAWGRGLKAQSCKHLLASPEKGYEASSILLSNSQLPEEGLLSTLIRSGLIHIGWGTTCHLVLLQSATPNYASCPPSTAKGSW